MTTTLVHRISEPLDSWLNDGKGLWCAPPWVRRCCVIVDDAIFHKRRSGMQIVNEGEYLVRELDGAVTFRTPEEFVREFRQ